jgi:hypothetical protein
MPEIKLEMWDRHQADEVRELLKQKLPEAHVHEGTHDIFGGEWNPDKHIVINYHDSRLVDRILREHFEPRGHDWHQFQK